MRAAYRSHSPTLNNIEWKSMPVAKTTHCILKESIVTAKSRSVKCSRPLETSLYGSLLNLLPTRSWAEFYLVSASQGTVPHVPVTQIRNLAYIYQCWLIRNGVMRRGVSWPRLDNYHAGFTASASTPKVWGCNTCSNKWMISHLSHVPGRQKRGLQDIYNKPVDTI